MKLLSAGDLNQILDIDTITRSTSTDGQSQISNTPFIIQRKACVVPTGGGEVLFRNIQLQTETRLLVRLWYDSQTRQISPNMTVVFAGRRYGILRAYDPFVTQREIWIECVEQK